MMKDRRKWSADAAFGRDLAVADLPDVSLLHQSYVEVFVIIRIRRLRIDKVDDRLGTVGKEDDPELRLVFRITFGNDRRIAGRITINRLVEALLHFWVGADQFRRLRVAANGELVPAQEDFSGAASLSGGAHPENPESRRSTSGTQRNERRFAPNDWERIHPCATSRT